MSDRTARRIGWTVFVATLALWLATICLQWEARAVSTFSGGGSPTTNFIGAVAAVLVLLTFSVTGLLIATRRPDNMIGRILLATGIGWALLGLRDELRGLRPAAASGLARMGRCSSRALARDLGGADRPDRRLPHALLPRWAPTRAALALGGVRRQLRGRGVLRDRHPHARHDGRAGLREREQPVRGRGVPTRHRSQPGPRGRDRGLHAGVMLQPRRALSPIGYRSATADQMAGRGSGGRRHVLLRRPRQLGRDRVDADTRAGLDARARLDHDPEPLPDPGSDRRGRAALSPVRDRHDHPADARATRS